MTCASQRIARQSNWRIFRIPLLLAILSLTGLVLGLTGEGWRDWASWALLCVPITAALGAWLRRN